MYVDFRQEILIQPSKPIIGLIYTTKRKSWFVYNTLSLHPAIPIPMYVLPQAQAPSMQFHNLSINDISVYKIKCILHILALWDHKLESLKKNKRKKGHRIFTAVKRVYALMLPVKEELVF